jgi:hypothetical protein
MIYSLAEAEKFFRDLTQESANLSDSFGIPISNNPTTGEPMRLGWNDQRDAFRHAYASAIAAYEHGWGVSAAGGYYREAEHLIDAYRKNKLTNNDWKELIMDIWNNRVGREIGANATSREEIAQRVRDALQNGQLIPDLNDSRVSSFPSIIAPGLVPTNPINNTRQAYTDARSILAPPPPSCPIVLDLDGDGVETTNVADGAYFDHDGNGFAEQTGLAAPDDGKELFDNETILNDGTKAANGFLALADLDSNADGKIDSNDSAFSQLKVWKDIDSDGYKRQAKGYRREAIGNEILRLAA